MTTYELMVLVAPSVDMTSEKAQKDLVKRLVGDTAVVSQVTNLGKKKLAYRIKKHDEATYLVAMVEGVIAVFDVEKRVKLIDDVIRYLLTVSETTK